MIKNNPDYNDYMGIGRCPRLKFIAYQAVNDAAASPGREWFITAIPVYSFIVGDNLARVHYTVRLERFNEDWSENLGQVCFTETEAKALVALLNGLQVAPTSSDKEAMDKALDDAYPLNSYPLEVTLKDSAEEFVKEKRAVKKGKNK